MSDRQALINAVLERPEDDIPRLVIADHYEENGEPERGEFVRVQIELAAMGDCPAWCDPADETCERRIAERRERLLWNAVRPTFGYDPIMSFWLGEASPDAEVLPLAIVSRGFVSAVRCRLADWVGEICSTCGGRKYVGECDVCGNTPDEDGLINHGRGCYVEEEDGGGSTEADDCPACNGERRTPAHGPRIVAEQPVERVEVSDKRPIPSNSTQGFRWVRERGDSSFNLSGAIFDLLPTGPTCTLIRDADVNWNSSFSVRDYESETAAQSALSLALINWARREAGMPPLKPNPG